MTARNFGLAALVGSAELPFKLPDNGMTRARWTTTSRRLSTTSIIVEDIIYPMLGIIAR